MNGPTNNRMIDRRMMQTVLAQIAAAAITTSVALAVWGYTIGKDVAVLAERETVTKERLQRHEKRIGALEQAFWPHRPWGE